MGFDTYNAGRKITDRNVISQKHNSNRDAKLGEIAAAKAAGTFKPTKPKMGWK
jgi:hypothetical protein